MSESLICLDRGPTRPTESVKSWRSNMKTLVAGFITGLMLTVSTAVEAHGHRAHGWHAPIHRHYHNPGWWIAPAIIGGAVTYAVTRPYIVEQPIIVQQAPVPVNPNQVIIDGVVYTKQIMIINGVQQEVLVRVSQ